MAPDYNVFDKESYRETVKNIPWFNFDFHSPGLDKCDEIVPIPYHVGSLSHINPQALVAQKIVDEAVFRREGVDFF